MQALKRKSWLIGSLTLLMLTLMGAPSVATPTWWTHWYDRDNPSGTGDWENRSGHGNVCLGDTVIGIEGQTLSGTPANLTGETFLSYNYTSGLICRNADQGDGYCQDYRVRYLCKGYSGGP